LKFFLIKLHCSSGREAFFGAKLLRPGATSSDAALSGGDCAREPPHFYCASKMGIPVAVTAYTLALCSFVSAVITCTKNGSPDREGISRFPQLPQDRKCPRCIIRIAVGCGWQVSITACGENSFYFDFQRMTGNSLPFSFTAAMTGGRILSLFRFAKQCPRFPDTQIIQLL